MNNYLQKAVILVATIGIAVLCCGDDKMNTKHIPIVKNVDINKYLGTWYEIARLPTRFEKGLVGVTATYSLRPDGIIQVLNQGFKDSLQGKRKTAKGQAWVPDTSQSGRLRVSFFLFFAADYRIIDLDQEAYSWAIVTSGAKKYLWILCRTPQMDSELYNRLIKKASEYGFDIDKLYKVPQSRGPRS